MKYGKLISMWPDSASSRSTISRRMVSNDSTEISRSWPLRISTKRDMCVPLKLCGRCTYMLNIGDRVLHAAALVAAPVRGGGSP